jgi:hypothetical protein
VLNPSWADTCLPLEKLRSDNLRRFSFWGGFIPKASDD